MTIAGSPRKAVTDRSLLTVITAHRRLDIRVPFDVAIAELMPELQEMLLTDQERDRAQAWVLAGAFGERIDPTRSLNDAGVLEGDLLRLENPQALGAPPMLSDVVEEVLAASGRRWSRSARRTVLLSCVVAWMALLAIVVEVVQPMSSTTLAGMCLLVAAVVTGGAIYLGRRGADVVAAHVVALGTMPLWAVGGAHLSSMTLASDPLAVTGIAGAVTLFALVIVFLGVPRIAATASGPVVFVAVVEVCVVVAHLTSSTGQAAAAVATMLWAGLLSFLPRIAAHISGLTAVARPELGPEASVRVRGDKNGSVDSSPDPALVTARVNLARKVLLSLQYGTLGGLVCAWAILATGNVWARWLIPISALVPVVRARRHHQVGEISTLIAASLAGVAAALAGYVNNSGTLIYSVAIAGVVAGLMAIVLVYAAVADAEKMEVNTVTLARIADKVEILLRVILLPLTIGAIGAFGAIIAIAEHFGKNLHF